MNLVRTLCAMAAWMFTLGAVEAQAESIEVAIRTEQDIAEAADPREAGRWYARSLGFKIVSVSADVVVVERDGHALRLSPGADRARFEVDSLSGALARPGMSIVAGPSVTRDPPRRHALVRASDGSLVELYERLDRWRG